MSKKKLSVKSKCCNAPVRIGGGENCRDKKAQITMYHVCTKCNQPCDTIVKERKTWEINPKTRVVPNKKKSDRLFSDKEIKKFLKEEDF